MELYLIWLYIHILLFFWIGTSDATLSYTITSGDTSLFSIDATSGEIFVAGKLDREASASYSLTVTATDGGLTPQTDTTTVNIAMDDQDDNPPICSKYVFTGILYTLFWKELYWKEISKNYHTLSLLTRNK